MPVAARPRHPPHAVEAPFVIFRDGYYYLFVSWDRCCDGADSDYKVMVGRSRGVTGPYVDAEGRAMLEGGGTLVLAGNERSRGPGHNSVLTTDAGQWIVHHTYDVQNLRAQRVLQIRPMSWTHERLAHRGRAPLRAPGTTVSVRVENRVRTRRRLSACHLDGTVEGGIGPCHPVARSAASGEFVPLAAAAFSPLQPRAA